MRPKSYSYRKTSRFLTKDLGVHDIQSDHVLAKQTEQKILRTGPISIAQYKRIWNYTDPVFGKKTKAYTIRDIQGKISTGLENIKEQPQFQGALDATMLYIKNRDLNRIFHNISNINGILYFMKQLNAKPSDVLFDGESNIIAAEEYWWPKSLRPDGVIMQWNKIIFLETDCGSHDYETLLEKSFLYKKLIDSGAIQRMGYTDISIVIHSFSKRIRYIDKKGCMDPVKDHVQYLDFLDNEFNYMDQFWPGTMSYKGAYKWLDRAIKKAKKEWEEEMNLLQKKRHRDYFRDPILFRNKVESLQQKGSDIENSQDGFEPVVDFEPDSIERELSVELWKSRKDRI